MLKIDIPGFKLIEAEYLVLDFNGTIAIDGRLIDDVIGHLVQVSEFLKVHVLTADTFGTVKNELKDLPILIKILEPENQDQQKLAYINNLRPDRVIAIGNGKNDHLMLREAALSIGIIQAEGAYSQIIYGTHLICTNINDALLILVNQKRLLATLRN
jgi:soluble P-type ATPase